MELKSDLIILIQRADEEGAAIQALRILKENMLLIEEEVTTYYQYLLKKYEGDAFWIEDLKDEILP